MALRVGYLQPCTWVMIQLMEWTHKPLLQQCDQIKIIFNAWCSSSSEARRSVKQNFQRPTTRMEIIKVDFEQWYKGRSCLSPKDICRPFVPSNISISSTQPFYHKDRKIQILNRLQQCQHSNQNAFLCHTSSVSRRPRFRRLLPRLYGCGWPHRLLSSFMQWPARFPPGSLGAIQEAAWHQGLNRGL